MFSKTRKVDRVDIVLQMAFASPFGLTQIEKDLPLIRPSGFIKLLALQARVDVFQDKPGTAKPLRLK